MSGLLRFPSLDRPSMGLSKRFSLLSSISSRPQDEMGSTVEGLRTLPTVETLDSDDFLSMFDSPTKSDLEPAESSRVPRDLPHELPSSPKTRRFSELPSNSIQRYELGASTVTKQVHHEQRDPAQSETDAVKMSYRSSVSSSNPSTKRSNASSRRTRKSSASSMTEGFSASERSSKDSDKENILHHKLKRRSKERRVSFEQAEIAVNTIDVDLYRARARSETALRHPKSHHVEPDVPLPPRPHSSQVSSRGNRLGNAIAGGTSPSLSSTHKSRTGRSSTINSATSVTIPLDPEKADRIKVGIMSCLEDINDLANCALISRDFYRTFQRYESFLVETVLRKQSVAAWQLRRSVSHLEKPTPFKMSSILRDYATITALEDFMLGQCQSVLRPQSLNALAGHAPRRKAELEDALWTIWTFCNAFGKSSMTDATLLKQTRWLNGGPRRKRQHTVIPGESSTPCTKKQLEDISEMWRCLETLLGGFTGREEEARQVGLFTFAGETNLNDTELLNLWIYDILSLGPKAVLTLSSCDFNQAKVLGVIRWKPPSKTKNRSNFLKAAVEEVYRERLVEEARRTALKYRKSVQYNHKRSTSDPPYAGCVISQSPVIPNVKKPPRLDTRKAVRHSMPPESLAPAAPPLEIRPDCDPLSPAALNEGPIMSPSSNPGIFSPLSMTKNASAKLGPSLFPMQNRDQSNRLSVPLPLTGLAGAVTYQMPLPDIVDPTDKAVALMVQEMGYTEIDAKRALALSDTGSGIDVQRAVEILLSDGFTSLRPRQSQICELPAGTGDARLLRKSSIKDICEGHCKPTLIVEPKRERVSGLGMVKRGLSYRMSFRKPARLSVIPDADESTTGTSRSTSRSGQKTPTVSTLATSAVSAFSTPALPSLLTSSASRTEMLGFGITSVSPISPVSPARQDPVQNNTRLDANFEVGRSYEDRNYLAPRPKVTLQRVGTGAKKSTWGLPGRKKKQQNVQPEIIGYAY